MSKSLSELLTTLKTESTFCKNLITYQNNLLIMPTSLKLFVIALFSLNLAACDGFDIESDDNSISSGESFTRSELAFNVVFSSLLLNNSGLSNNRDGFIVLFNSSSDLDEIELRNSGNDDVLVGNYPWTIVNDKLQVTYPDGITCTSTKTSETSSEYVATSRCDGGEPENDRISSTLRKPINLDNEDFFSRTFFIDNNNINSKEDQRVDFFSNGTFELIDIDSNGDEIANTVEVGVFQDSTVFDNVIRLNNSDVNSDEYSRFILLDGGLSSGTILQLRYVASTNKLSEVIIYTIDSENRWDADSVYNDIVTDS